MDGRQNRLRDVAGAPASALMIGSSHLSLAGLVNGDEHPRRHGRSDQVAAGQVGRRSLETYELAGGRGCAKIALEAVSRASAVAWVRLSRVGSGTQVSQRASLSGAFWCNATLLPWQQP